MTALPPTRGQAPISRFAPSPTGLLHLGHAFSAICAYDVVPAGGGRFILRIEDIDSVRCRPEYTAAIEDDLRWLGIDWDARVVQSQRLPVYANALEQLTAQRLTYRCVCTRAEIAASASAPHGAEAIYPGTCRRVPVPEDDPRLACVRLDMAKAVAATEHAAALVHGDVVLARKDGGPSYHLAAVVDDGAQGVTHVVRGEDLRAAADVHIVLQRLLRLPTPEIVHHALVLGPDGKRLAKRTPGATLADLRAAGTDPRALAADLRRGVLPLGFGFGSA